METNEHTPSLKKESATDTELKDLFGESAIIENNQDGTLRVTTKLEDGTVQGGQQLSVNLSPRTKVTRDYLLGKLIPIKIPGYMGKNLTVNGADVSTIIPQIFFLARPETQKTSYFASMLIPADTIKTSPDARTKQALRRVGTAMLPIQKIPVMSSLDNADDLVSLLHEQGHINTDGRQPDSTAARRRLDNKSTDTGMELYDTLDKFKSKKNADTPHTATIYNDLLTVLDEERSACLDAKAIISDSGLASVFFPSDPQLSTMNDFLHDQLITYANYADGYFNKFLTNDQRAALSQKTIL